MTQVTASDLDRASQFYSRTGNRQLAAVCADLATKLLRYGSWKSDRQRDFAESLVEQATDAPPAPPAPPAVALANMGLVKVALDAAHGRGLKRPTLRVHDGTSWFIFKRAPDDGRNPGRIYVTRDYLYIGKIDPDGSFHRSRDCMERDVGVLKVIAEAPLIAARNSGKLTGQCSCCGKALSDPQSQQDGIGPICKRKYFD